jgi:ribosomal protein S18 acetylase RimI-like enzyme
LGGRALIAIRRLTPDDAHVVRAMFVHTFRWRDDTPAEPVADPALAHYIAGWPRPGDDGVMAEEGSGDLVGAAWYRLFDESDHGFGFVSATVPEVGIAVTPAYRGRGIGLRLMSALIELAAASGHPALSLGVEKEDARAIRLYEKLGFERVGTVGGAWTMLRRTDSVLLHPDSPITATDSGHLDPNAPGER